MKTKKEIIVSSPIELLKDLDALAEVNFSYSEIVEKILREYLIKENRKGLNKRDIEIINANAEILNKQALETLELQADLKRII